MSLELPATETLKSTASGWRFSRKLCRIYGLFPICATIFRDLTKNMAETAGQKKVALFGCSPVVVTEFGALLYYGADNYRVGQRGAWYIDRILKGTKRHDLPVEIPSYFEMIVNLKTAKQIGLTIPPNVLARADRVIK
jgi:ABC-type uncharacterized transport system substrate-binding protein